MEVAISRRAVALCEAAALLINDQERLEVINSISKSDRVRAAAISRMTDQSFLVNLMLEDHSHLAVGAACKRIRNQIHLANYLKEAPDSPKEDFRKRAVLANLTDQGLLKEIAAAGIKISKLSTLSTILSRITDEDFVKDLLRSRLRSDKASINPSVFANINDQDFLKNIAADPEIPFGLRKGAVARVSDSKFLTKMVLQIFDSGALWNGSLLRMSHTLLEDERQECAFLTSAIRGINDSSFLKKLGSNIQITILLGEAIRSRIAEIGEKSNVISSVQRQD